MGFHLLLLVLFWLAWTVISSTPSSHLESTVVTIIAQQFQIWQTMKLCCQRKLLYRIDSDANSIKLWKCSTLQRCYFLPFCLEHDAHTHKQFAAFCKMNNKICTSVKWYTSLNSIRGTMLCFLPKKNKQTNKQNKWKPTNEQTNKQVKWSSRRNEILEHHLHGNEHNLIEMRCFPHIFISCFLVCHFFFFVLSYSYWSEKPFKQFHCVYIFHFDIPWRPDWHTWWLAKERGGKIESVQCY